MTTTQANGNERIKRRRIYAQWDVLLKLAKTPDDKRRAFGLLERATRCSLEAERHVATVFEEVRSELREHGYPTALVPLVVSEGPTTKEQTERQRIFEAWGMG